MRRTLLEELADAIEVAREARLRRLAAAAELDAAMVRVIERFEEESDG